ncbi:hypothetical protein BDB00DRAFT_857354 [Zychaea mexicana]|uniref:uncharacterized protein n=1 Tax=Zychaea mexicana TaxID=64656 RepID=UPI0022FF3CFC|nr:uncharacterized protein BDB00DRAFT_857354 [Zychaea mexicana]KAI9482557.1 hypothetical protein BDB00DRAFT_857354 [Zychaea mexicana]
MVLQPLLLPSPPNTAAHKMATTTAPPTAHGNTTAITNTATTNTTNHHKKHTRHHVKRRSTGRVHVTKLAPMARANASAHTDTEADEYDHTGSTKRPHMRRSQSQRSLNRLSSFERKGGMTAMAPLHPPQPQKNTAISNSENNNSTITANTSTISPPTTPPLQAKGKQQQQRSLPPPSSASSSSSSSSSSSEEVEEMEIKKHQQRLERNVEEDQEIACPTPSVSSPTVLRNDCRNSNKSLSTIASKPSILSQRGTAAPIEQTFNAVANNLVAPDKAALPAFHKQATSPSKSPSSQSDSHKTKKRMPPLRSQFIDEHSHHHNSNNSQQQQQHPESVAADPHHSQHSNSLKRSNMEKSPRQSNVASAATAQPPGISRTQQKLLLQRQHCLVDDENNLGHPRNMLRLTRELERVGREYRCVRRYRDPMLESLQRCASAGNVQQQEHNPHPRRLQVNHRTRSFSVLPSSSNGAYDHPDNDHPIPHSEQRQAIHRRQQQLKLLAMANHHSNGGNSNHRHSLHTYSSGGMHSSSHQQQQQSNTALDMIRWSAGALLDRVWYGGNGSS